MSGKSDEKGTKSEEGLKVASKPTYDLGDDNIPPPLRRLNKDSESIDSMMYSEDTSSCNTDFRELWGSERFKMDSTRTLFPALSQQLDIEQDVDDVGGCNKELKTRIPEYVDGPNKSNQDETEDLLKKVGRQHGMKFYKNKFRDSQRSLTSELESDLDRKKEKGGAKILHELNGFVCGIMDCDCDKICTSILGSMYTKPRKSHKSL